MQPKPRSAVLVTKGRSVLLIERIKVPESVYYVLPGGGIEAGETPEQAASREMKEELGVDITVRSIEKDLSAASRETWIVRASIKGDTEPVWIEEHKQSPANSYKVVWFPISELGTISVFPEGVVSTLE